MYLCKQFRVLRQSSTITGAATQVQPSPIHLLIQEASTTASTIEVLTDRPSGPTLPEEAILRISEKTCMILPLTQCQCSVMQALLKLAIISGKLWRHRRRGRIETERRPVLLLFLLGTSKETSKPRRRLSAVLGTGFRGGGQSLGLVGLWRGGGLVIRGRCGSRLVGGGRGSVPPWNGRTPRCCELRLLGGLRHVCRHPIQHDPRPLNQCQKYPPKSGALCARSHALAQCQEASGCCTGCDAVPWVFFASGEKERTTFHQPYTTKDHRSLVRGLTDTIRLQPRCPWAFEDLRSW